MKISIPGLTEAEIVAIIDNVAKNYRCRPFGVFNSDDLYQHARTFCVAKIGLFDYSRHKDNKNLEKALESWLNRIVSNQMKNLFRDNVKKAYKTYQKDKSENDKFKRASLLNPEHIGHAYYTNLFGTYEDKINHDAVEMLRNITRHLSDEDFEVLDSILNEESIPSSFKKKILDICQSNMSL